MSAGAEDESGPGRRTGPAPGRPSSGRPSSGRPSSGRPSSGRRADWAAHRRYAGPATALVTLLLLGFGTAVAQGGGLTVPWSRAANGGAVAITSGGLTLSGTFGQAEAGMVTSGNTTLTGGFWAAEQATVQPTLTSPPATVTPPPTATASATIEATATGTATATATAVATTAATVTSTVTSPATAVPTSTPAPTVTSGTPYPRPNVGVVTAPSPGGRLLVTISARDADCSANGRLSAVQIVRTDNATVEIGARLRASGPFTEPLPSRPAQVTLFVDRVRPDLPSTVQLVVVDGCGEWRTFVGGGPGAF